MNRLFKHIDTEAHIQVNKLNEKEDREL